MIIIWVNVFYKLFSDILVYTFPQSSALGRLQILVHEAGDYVQITYQKVVRINS
jgi:ABC-type uncharacterized transport system auxiliary subunit